MMLVPRVLVIRDPWLNEVQRIQLDGDEFMWSPLEQRVLNVKKISSVLLDAPVTAARLDLLDERGIPIDIVWLSDGPIAISAGCSLQFAVAAISYCGRTQTPTRVMLPLSSACVEEPTP